jgi:hydrogenase expression/formation protein HypD
MKHVSEYREREVARRLVDSVKRAVTRRWVIMEVCGGQTHTIVRYGLDELLCECVELIHGPGCPVCVTPVEDIDTALELAQRRSTIFTSFGDMLRVPGTASDLLRARADGADVRTVYSPLDALELARSNPSREVVFFAVGFETTAPVTAMAVRRASELRICNFSLLVSHVVVPPAVEAILAAPRNRVQAILAAGHVCTVMGWREYQPIAQRYHVPVVVTGFEPLDILQGLLMAVVQLETRRHDVENQYTRSVRPEGNQKARAAMTDVFRRVDRPWRGLGTLPLGGLALREEYAAFDARRKFAIDPAQSAESGQCLAGEVLRGLIKPVECPAFRRECTPEHPLGAPMVSSEGACAAYYRHRGPVALVAANAHA